MLDFLRSSTGKYSLIPRNLESRTLQTPLLAVGLSFLGLFLCQVNRTNFLSDDARNTKHDTKLYNSMLKQVEPPSYH